MGDGVREVRVCGLHACRALLLKRPQDVQRVFVTESRVAVLGEALKARALARQAYHVVPDEEVAAVSGSSHHEGVCVVAAPRAQPSFGELLDQLRRERGPRVMVGLHDVVNPHNLGAILRVCAHFGVQEVLCLGNTPALLSAAAHRTAEGAAESVNVIAAAEAEKAIQALKGAGVKVMATSPRSPRVVYSAPVPASVLWLMGSEEFGLPAGLLELADQSVRIPGAGTVESLNVACAVTALLGEWWRQHASTTSAPAPPADRV